MTESENDAFELMRDELERLQSIFLPLIEDHDPIGRIERILDIVAATKKENP